MASILDLSTLNPSFVSRPMWPMNGGGGGRICLTSGYLFDRFQRGKSLKIHLGCSVRTGSWRTSIGSSLDRVIQLLSVDTHELSRVVASLFPYSWVLLFCCYRPFPESESE